jgi:class 3 adenylate cyclase
VSVLFADLVGFTTLSEARDAEEVRELLSTYFDTSRTLVERYGGVVEKFIGDAVMAVWGTPVTNEDDAERAARAAIDLVDAVASLGESAGVPDLRARAGVLTGEAAVNLGATGQGMVAGDLVSTASRIQSAADPGTVLVGEATRRATEASVAYASAGTHEMKGKAEPVELWRASRVIAGVRGLMKSEGLEPPFVGRELELKLVKDLFHASADEARAQLVRKHRAENPVRRQPRRVAARGGRFGGLVGGPRRSSRIGRASGWSTSRSNAPSSSRWRLHSIWATSRRWRSSFDGRRRQAG